MAAFNPYDRKPSRNANQTVVQQYGTDHKQTLTQTASVAEFPVHYVDAAEQIIKEMDALKQNNLYMTPISTSKLRKLFGLFTGLYDEIRRSDAKLLTESQMQVLTSARVRIVYECGRDKKSDRPKNEFDNVVEYFVRKTRLLDYLTFIGSSTEKFTCYYHYFEALVAYHRFYFGEVKDRGQ